MDKIDYGPRNQLNLKTLITLSRTNNTIAKQSAALFKAHGLTTMQFAVLEVLYHKGDLSIGEVIRKILATGGNMTVVVRNLVKEGLAEKYYDPADQRVCMLHITEKGSSLISQIFPAHLKQLDETLAPLSEQDKEELTRILKKMKK